MSDSSPILVEEDSDSKKVSFHVDENPYETVEFVSRRNDKCNIVIQHNGSRKCLATMSVFLIIAILLGAAVSTVLPLLNNKLKSDLNEVSFKIDSLNAVLYGHSEPFPVLSCASLPPSSESGYYWVKDSFNSPIQVYCDMTRSCGGVTGGWTRVAELDMMSNTTHCPNGFRQRLDDFDLLTCVRTDANRGCSSINIDLKRMNYSLVCGMVVAYQLGSTHAFHGLTHPGIDTNYVDGVSLTHGKPRKHIWTFASALNEKSTAVASSCPCINSSDGVRQLRIPSIVGNDYFCDTGNQYSNQQPDFYSANPLWDGEGCGQHSTCCIFNTPPWFHKQLHYVTTDDIEMRVCRDGPNWQEDIAIEEFHIYVQ